MRTCVVLFVMIMGTYCWGCTGSRSDSVSHYAKVNKCDFKQVRAVRQERGYYSVSGCGPTELYNCTRGACVAVTMLVAQRHAQLYGCHYTKVHVRELPGGGWQAEGCERRGSYMCAWVKTDREREELQCANDGQSFPVLNEGSKERPEPREAADGKAPFI